MLWVRAVVLCLFFVLASCSEQPLGPRLNVSPPPAPLFEEQNATWLDQINTLGKQGYWLVIRGYKEADDFIVMATNTPLSHAAVLDLEGGQVIEAMGEGVITTPLDAFITHGHRFLLIEPIWWTPERGSEAVARAHELVGSGYDFSGLVGLSSDDRFYCSELAFHIYSDHHTARDHVPKVIEPALMYLWGTIVWDSRPRD